MRTRGGVRGGWLVRVRVDEGGEPAVYPHTKSYARLNSSCFKGASRPPIADRIESMCVPQATGPPPSLDTGSRRPLTTKQNV